VPESQGGPVAFGRYRVQEKLGAGGMGAVYLARDDELGREVAVKVLRPLAAVGEPPRELIERFRREARAVALLSHANVVRVYDQGVEGDFPYLVMELVPGPTLADRIAAGPLELREVRTLGIQLASALDAAHAAGIVHRDVKPSNVLQSQSGIWKLADFGIAHIGDSTSAGGSLTITGQFLGTPAYAAPEMLEGSAAGRPSDVYSLAATLYAALAGEPPYGDANLARLIVAIGKGERPPPIAERRPDVPPGIAAALERAMAIDPAARPTASELAHELAVAASGIATPVPGALATAVVPPLSARRATGAAAGSGSRARLFFIIAAIGFGALALGLILGDRGGGGGTRAAGSPASAGLGSVPQPAPSEEPVASPDSPMAAGELGAPPWQNDLPPELASRQFGKPSEQTKRWRKAQEKLARGEWDKGAEELYKILDADPSNQTARRWLAWMDAAARDPRGQAGWIEIREEDD
jgi:eukaryotic-like serine/threonine-protein kinase